MLACWKALLMSLHFCCSGSEMVHHRTSIPPSAGVGGGGAVGKNSETRLLQPQPLCPISTYSQSCASALPSHCGLLGHKEGAGLTGKAVRGPCTPCTCPARLRAGPFA